MPRSVLRPTWDARVPSLIAAVLGLGLITSACRGDETERPTNSPTVAHPTEPLSEPASELSADDAKPEPPESRIEPTPYTPASTLGEPIEIRRAKRSRAVYFEPDTDTPLRGRINSGDNFQVFAHREADGCKKPWAQVAESGWVCLERTELDDAPPKALPILPAGELLPFIYARHQDHEDASTPPLSVYASVSAFNRGDAPIDTLPAYGSYAFVRSVANHGKRVLVTASRRAVSAEQLETFEPSEFAGETLDADAIPPDMTLAWAVRWNTLIHAAADPETEVVGRVPYHDPLFVIGDGVLGPDGERWFQVPEHPNNPATGWISDHDVQRFLPVAPPDPVLAGQMTVDVDLDQQVLSVWREDVPVFATLISSGKPGDATPVGLYRIETKWAYGKMSSLASADEPYYVDAVPWAMYFDGRFAFHAAYWHDLFGHRQSHGCVNLSPHDARHVFELVTPALPAGWLIVHEHARDPGALVVIRSGERELPDHRAPLDPPSSG